MPRVADARTASCRRRREQRRLTPFSLQACLDFSIHGLHWPKVLGKNLSFFNLFISRPTPSGNNSLAAQISENDASNLFVSELLLMIYYQTNSALWSWYTVLGFLNPPLEFWVLHCKDWNESIF
jgi:hypothetical protein